jgi:hypothetical protein
MRGLPFDRRAETLIADRSDTAPIIQPMLAAWRQLCEQIAAFNKAVHALVRRHMPSSNNRLATALSKLNRQTQGVMRTLTDRKGRRG